MNLNDEVKILVFADECHVYDNTITPQIVYYKNKQGHAIYENSYWPREKIIKLINIPEANI